MSHKLEGGKGGGATPSSTTFWFHTVLTVNTMGMHLYHPIHSIMFIHVFDNDLMGACLVSGTTGVLSCTRKQDTGLTVISADRYISGELSATGQVRTE